MYGSGGGPPYQPSSSATRANLTISSLSSQPQPLHGHLDALVKTLNDMSQRDDLKLRALQEISSSMDDIPNSPSYNVIADNLLRAFLRIFKETSPQCVSENNTQMLRKLMLEMIQRLSFTDAMKTFAKPLESEMIRCIITENEENGMIALKILTEHIKQFRLPFVGEITNLMSHFKMMYRDMVHHCGVGTMFLTRRQVLPQWNFEDGTLENTLQQCFCVTSVHVDSNDGQDRQMAYTLIPRGYQSVKVLGEVPSLIILLCNMYKQQVLSDLGDLTQIIASYLAAKIPANIREEQGFNKEVADEFLNSQIRAFTFLAFYAKASPAGGNASDFFQNNASQVINSMVALFEACPSEPILPRRELLVAARYFFNSEYQINFVHVLPRLLNNNTLLGDGVTVNECLRVSVVQMLCDLCHHLRNQLTFQVLVNVVYFFSLMLHTSQIYGHSQAMCCKGLMNLVEAFANLEKNRNEPCRDVFLHMLDTFVRKFRFMAKHHVEPLLQKYSYTPRQRSRMLDPQMPTSEAMADSTKPQGDADDSDQAYLGSACTPGPNVSSSTKDRGNEESVPYSRDSSISMSADAGTPMEIGESTERPSDSSRTVAAASSSEPSSDSNVSHENRTPRYAIPSLPPPTKPGDKYTSVAQLCTTYNSNPPFPTNPADARAMVRVLMQSIKLIGVGITHSHVTTEPPFSSDKERTIMSKLFVDGLRCLEVFTISQVPNSSPGLFQRVYSRSGVRARDEKEALDYFTNTFTMVNTDVFESIFARHVDFLFEKLLQNNALQFVVNGFLCSANISVVVGREILKYLLRRLGDLSEVNDRSSMYLKIFKMVFSSVSSNNPLSTQAHEKMLKSHLHQLVYKSMKFALRAPDPTQYFLLLRSLFRSIGNGSHDLLYQSFLPLLPALLQQMCRIHSGRHRQSVRELFCELCLTVPVRLSSLLPYLPLLMDPLVYAFSGSTSLVQQGLRTLELCVDNLQPEYLYYYMAPVRSPLMQGIWRVIRQSSDVNCTTVALRITGKFGGLNRKMLLEAPHLDYTLFHEEDSFPSMLMKFRRAVDGVDMDNGSRDEDMDELSQQSQGPTGVESSSTKDPIKCEIELSQSVLVALDHLRTTISGDVDSNRGVVLRTVTHKLSSLSLRQHSMRLCRGVLLMAMRTTKLRNTDFREEIMKTVNLAKLAEEGTDAIKRPLRPFRCSNVKAREMYKNALTAIIMSAASRDLHEDVLPFFYLFVRFLTVLLVLEQRGRCRSADEMRSSLDGMILIDAVCEVLADAHLEFTKPAVVALELVHETAMYLTCSDEVVAKLPLYGYILDQILALCFETQWYARHGACSALLYIVTAYPLEVVHRYAVRIINGIVEVFFGLNDEVSFGTIEMARKAVRALFNRCFEKPDQEGLSQEQIMLAGSITCRLMDNICDSVPFVREQVMEIFDELSAATDLSLSELFGMHTDRLSLLMDRGARLFMNMSASFQVGFLEAYACVHTQKVPILEFDYNDSNHVNFLSNLILICEADETRLEQKSNYAATMPSLKYPYSNAYDRLMPLKLAAIKAAIGGYVSVCQARRRLIKQFREKARMDAEAAKEAKEAEVKKEETPGKNKDKQQRKGETSKGTSATTEGTAEGTSGSTDKGKQAPAGPFDAESRKRKRPRSPSIGSSDSSSETSSSSGSSSSSEEEGNEPKESKDGESAPKDAATEDDVLKGLKRFVLVEGVPYTTHESRLRVDRKLEAHLQLMQIVFKTAIYGHPKLQELAYKCAMDVMEYCPEGRDLLKREMQLISKDFLKEATLDELMTKRILYIHNMSKGVATEMYFETVYKVLQKFSIKDNRLKMKAEFFGCSFLLDLLNQSEKQCPKRWITTFVPLVSRTDAHLALPGVDWKPKLKAFLNKHAEEAIKFLVMEENLLNEPIWRLYVEFMKDEKSEPLRTMFIKKPEIFTHLLKEEVMFNKKWVHRSAIYQPPKFELAALNIVWVVAKNHQEWWASSEEHVAAVRTLWNDPKFVHRYCMKHEPRDGPDKDRPLVDYVDETKFRLPKLALSILLVYYRNNIDEIGLLYELTSVFSHKFISDFVFFRQYINETVIPTFPLYWRRAAFYYVVEHFVRNAKEAAVNHEIARFMQYVVVPSFAYAFDRYNADDVVGSKPNPDEVDDNNVISVLVRKIIDVCRVDMSDQMLVAMYQFCILLVQHCPNHIHEYNQKLKQIGRLRIFMVFAWPCLQAQGPQDITVKYNGYLLIAHIIDKFAINRKIVLQVHSGLMKAYAQDNRDIIKRALDVITPALPKRMDDGYLQLLTFMKKMISEESHNVQQMTHSIGTVVRHYKVYYYVRHHLLPFLVSAIQRLMHTHHTLESKKLIIDVCETIIKWELLRLKLVEQNVSTDEMDIDQLLKETARVPVSQEPEVRPRMRHSPQRSLTTTMIPTTSSLQAGGNEEVHRPLDRHFADQAFNTLIRIATQTGEQVALQTQQNIQVSPATDTINKRAMMLLKAACKPSVWGLAANLNHSMYEKQLRAACDNPNVSGQQIIQTQVAVDALSSLIVYIPKNSVVTFVQPLQRALSLCVTSNQASILRAMYTLLQRLLERTKCTRMGLEELGILNEGLVNFINDSFNTFARSSPSVMQSIVAPLHILRLMSTSNDGFLEAMCSNPFMKMFTKLVKEHIEGMVPKGGSSSRGEPKDFLTAETCFVAMDLLCTQMPRLTIDTRQSICRNVLVTLIERGACDKLLSALIKIADEFLKLRDDSSLLCGVPLLCEMLKHLEDRILGNRDLLQSFLYSVAAVYENPRLRVCEGVSRLDAAFYWGVCCNDENLRGRFMVVWDERISPFLFKRIQYFFSEQDWRPLIQHFWVKHCLHLCMFSLNGVKRGSSDGKKRSTPKRTFNTALRSELTNSCTLYNTFAYAVGRDLSLLQEGLPPEDIDCSRVLPEDRQYNLPICPSIQTVLSDYEGSVVSFLNMREEKPDPDRERKEKELRAPREGDSRIPTGLDRVFEEFFHLLNVSSEFRFEDMVPDFLELCYNDSSLACSSWIKMFSTMWSGFDDDERSTIGPNILKFLGSGTHSVQKDCEISVIRCFVDALLLCDPLITLPRSLISYLACSHNDWHKALLHFEGELCKLGKTSLLNAHEGQESSSVSNQIKLYDALRLLYGRLNERDQLEMIWERRSFFEETSRLMQLQNLGDYAQVKKEMDTLVRNRHRAFNGTSVRAESYQLEVRQECRQWMDTWIDSLRSLGEWSTVFDFANRENQFDCKLVVESAVQLSEWDAVKDCIDLLGPSLPDEDMPMCAIYNAMSSITAGEYYDDSARAEVETIEKEASLYLIQAWRQLPSIVSHSHMNLLRQAQLLQEVHEGSVVARNLTSIMLERKSSDITERVADVTQPAAEIKSVVKTWRNRQLSLLDDLGASTEIAAWRLFHFETIQGEAESRQEHDRALKFLESKDKQKMDQGEEGAKAKDHDDGNVREGEKAGKEKEKQQTTTEKTNAPKRAETTTTSSSCQSPRMSESLSDSGHGTGSGLGHRQVGPLLSKLPAAAQALDDMFILNLNTYSQTLLGVAKVFRQSNQYALALNYLNTLHTMPEVMRADACAKCCEHAKTLAKLGSSRSTVIKSLSQHFFTQKDDHLLEALDLIQTMTLDQMTADENSRILSLRAGIMSRLDADHDASKAFVLAGKVYNISNAFTCNYVWKFWGEYLEKQYDKNPRDERIGIQALYCYFNCSRVETRSRKYIAKVLWLMKQLSVMCTQDAVRQMEETVKKGAECVPTANFVVWLHELVCQTKQLGSPLALQLLTHIAKNNPEPLFYVLRKALPSDLVNQRIGIVNRKLQTEFASTMERKGKRQREAKQKQKDNVPPFARLATNRDRLLAILDLTVRSRPTDITCLNDLLGALESFSIGWYERQIIELKLIKTMCYKEVLQNQHRLLTAMPSDELCKAVTAWAHFSLDGSERSVNEPLEDLEELMKKFDYLSGDVKQRKITLMALYDSVVTFLEIVQEGARTTLRPSELLRGQSYLLSCFSTKEAYIDIFGCVMTTKQQQAQYTEKIARFLPTYGTVYQNGKVYRLISVLSECGKVYTYSLEQRETDVQNQESVYRMFGLLNSIISRDHECSRRLLLFNQPSVVPVGMTTSLHEYAPFGPTYPQPNGNSKLFRYSDIYMGCLRERRVAELPDRIVLNIYKEAVQRGITPNAEFFSEIYDRFVKGNETVKAISPPDMMSKWMARCYPNPTHQWIARKQTACYLGMYFLSEFIFHLSSMDLDFMVLNVFTGQTVAMEYEFDIGHDQENGIHLAPGKGIPFRLSPNLNGFVGASVDGHMKNAMIALARCLESHDTVSLIRPVLYDLIYKAAIRLKLNVKETVPAMIQAGDAIITRIRGAATLASGKNTVFYMLYEANKKANLCRVDPILHPWF